MNINENEIIAQIEANNLEAARKSIESIESVLKSTKLKYTQRILRDKINKLKSIFSAASKKANIDELTTKNTKQYIHITKENSSEKESQSIEIKNQKDKNLVIDSAQQIFITDSMNIKTDFFESYDSLSIRNTCNSEFVCKAKQVRLSNCSNVEMTVFTETGVYLEGCKNIVIKKLEIESDLVNLYDEVYDFNDLMRNNFKVM